MQWNNKTDIVDEGFIDMKKHPRFLLSRKKQILKLLVE